MRTFSFFCSCLPFGTGGYPLPPRIFGIIVLARNCEVILGHQQLAGKILSRKELGAALAASRLALRL